MCLTQYMNFKNKLQNIDLPEIKNELLDSVKQRNLLRQNIKNSPYHLKLHNFNVFKAHKKILSDKSINYNISELQKPINKFIKTIRPFKDMAADLVKIHDLHKNSLISDFTYYFIVTRFYSANYDLFINYFKILANLINDSKNHPQQKATKAWQVFKYLGTYDKSIEKNLRKFLNQDLRNSIEHNDSEIKGRYLWYTIKSKGKEKRHKMLLDSFFGKITNMGLLINLTQEATIKLTLILCNKFIKDKSVQTKAEFKKLAQTNRYWP